MKTVLPLATGGFGLSEIPPPVVTPGDILVEMKACGLCGTHLAKLSQPQMSVAVRLGHEFAGVVRAVGPGVFRFAPGDRVTAAHRVPCGSCWACRHGSESMCRQFKETYVEPCGVAELIRIPRPHAEQVTFRLPDGMIFEEASFTEPLACAVRAVERSQVMPGDRIAVVGGGGMGLLIAQRRAHARGRGHRPEHRAEAETIWGLEPGTLNGTPGYHTMDMFRAFMRGDVKVLWTQTTNPWVTIPNLHRMDRQPGDGRFLVVSDIYPTPTTAAADLVLPSAAWVEREGVFGNTERRTQQWMKAVDPPGEAREDAWQIIEVARRMGMGHLFPWPDDAWHEPMYEEYRRFTLGHGKDLASYGQLRESRGLLWPVVNGVETRYRYAAGHDPYVKKSRGVHFYKAKGYGERAAFWLRPWHPPAESPDEAYPFWLCTGRVLEHWHSGSMTRRIPSQDGDPTKQLCARFSRKPVYMGRAFINSIVGYQAVTPLIGDLVLILLLHQHS